MPLLPWHLTFQMSSIRSIDGHVAYVEPAAVDVVVVADDDAVSADFVAIADVVDDIDVEVADCGVAAVEVDTELDAGVNAEAHLAVQADVNVYAAVTVDVQQVDVKVVAVVGISAVACVNAYVSVRLDTSVSVHSDANEELIVIVLAHELAPLDLDLVATAMIR
jgi:hypothetical protein